jgi:uncharacterized membrane protein
MNLSKYAIGAFLLLYAITVLVETKIPNWVLGVVALAAGLICVVEAVAVKKTGA